MDHASLEELAKSYLRLRFDTAGAQRGKRKAKVGRGVSTRQTSSQNLGNVTAIESGKGPKLVFSAPLMVVPTHEQRTIGPAGTETALLDPNRVHHEYCRIMDIVRMFDTEQKAYDWLARYVWPNGPVCPFCGSDNVQSGIKHP